MLLTLGSPKPIVLAGVIVVSLALVAVPALAATAQTDQELGDLHELAIAAAARIVHEETPTLDASATQASVAEQRRRAEQRRHGLYKIYVGAGIAGLGGLLAATSSESVCVTNPFTREEDCITARSNAQLYGGLGMLGAGGVLMWMGVNDRREPDMNASNPANAEGLSVNLGYRSSVKYRLQW